MKQTFIKQIDQYVNKFNLRNWRRKDVESLASEFVQLCYYTSGLFSSFKAVRIDYNNDCLVFAYADLKGVKGGAKLRLDEMMQSILLPAIKDVAAKYGKDIYTHSNNIGYKIAA